MKGSTNKIKCNFTVSIDTKQKLEHLKSVTGFSIGSIIDMLVRTQDDSILKYSRKDSHSDVSSSDIV